MTTTPAAAAIRRTDHRDATRLAILRRAWTEEETGQPLEDDDFEDRFVEWYAAEAARRVTFVAELGDDPIGMINLTTFRRMPKPGRAASHWSYVANAFVLAAFRDRGIGTALLDTAIAHARDTGSVRIVLSPSERATPYYERAGFGQATMLMAKHLGC